MRKDKLLRPADAKILGWVLLGFGVLLIVLAWGGDAPPAQERLQQASGRVAWVERSRTALRFKLAGDGRVYRYLSRGGELRAMHDWLNAAQTGKATLLFDAQPEQRGLFDDADYHAVYAVVVEGHGARSYAQIREAWLQNDGMGLMLGVVFALAGGGFLFHARRARG